MFVCWRMHVHRAINVNFQNSTDLEKVMNTISNSTMNKKMRYHLKDYRFNQNLGKYMEVMHATLCVVDVCMYLRL